MLDRLLRVTTDLAPLLDVLPGGLLLTEGSGHRVRYANARVRTLADRLGLPPVGGAVTDLLSGPELAETLDLLNRAYHAGEVVQRPELRLDLPEPSYWRVTFGPIREEGHVAGLLILLEDLTQEVQARHAAEERAALLEAILESMAEAVVVVDGEGRVRMANQVARQAMAHDPRGSTLAEMRTVYDLRDPQGEPLPLEAWPLTRALAGETFHGEEVLAHRADGQDLVLSISGAPARDPAGRILAGVVVFHDITERRAVEQLKDELIGLVSHELRGPTTTIRGGLNLLRRYGPRLDYPLRDVLRDVEAEANRLDRLIRDLLDLARTEMGLVPASEPVAPLPLLTRLVEEYAALPDAHPVVLRAGPDLPPVLADPTYLEQVLRNLLENARKFSPPGAPVEVTAERRGRAVRFGVLDRGPGVPEADRQRIFQPFYRTLAGHRAQGAGLGLTLAQRLVTAMGGQIWVENRPRGGAAFYFTIPLSQAR
ncbi:MAG TPA: ATP-binding protein [Dehalococcoidia bacterium]